MNNEGELFLKDTLDKDTRGGVLWDSWLGRQSGAISVFNLFLLHLLLLLMLAKLLFLMLLPDVEVLREVDQEVSQPKKSLSPTVLKVLLLRHDDLLAFVGHLLAAKVHVGLDLVFQEETQKFINDLLV